MRAEDIEEMRSLPLLAGVAPDHADTMLQVSYLQRFPAHVDLVREGDRADFLHVVIEGRVEEFSQHNGRETTVGILGPGHCFITAAVLLDRIYLKSARALSAARILMIPTAAVHRCFAADAAFARAMAIELATAYRDVVKDLKNQKLRTAQERLANWLLIRNDETGGHGRFDLVFDKRVLAARLGMAPEVLSRTFAALGGCRVRVEGRSIHLDDVDALCDLAHPCPTIDDPTT